MSAAAPLLNYERTLGFLKIPGSLCERFTVISPDEMMDIKLYFNLYKNAFSHKARAFALFPRFEGCNQQLIKINHETRQIGRSK